MAIDDSKEIKINARGLSNPGPRLMVQNTLSRGKYHLLRVVVSHNEAVDDLKAYFELLHARVEVDQIGDDYHMLVDLSTAKKKDKA